MVSTLKFSQFGTGTVGDPTNIPVGLGDGVNVQIPPYIWTVSTRPATPYNGLLGYNTDLSQYEYWNASTSVWDQLLTSSTGFNWSVVTASSVNADVNSGIVANRSATPVSILLPASMNVGDEIKVLGMGTGGWSLVANTGQTIIFGNQTSSSAGSWSSTQQSDTIRVICQVANTTWQVLGSVSAGLTKA